MHAIMYVICLLILSCITNIQPDAHQFSHREILAAINLYEQELTTHQQKHSSSLEVNKFTSKLPTQLLQIKKLCLYAIASDCLAYLASHLVGSLQYFFDNAALGGDLFTGNQFIEGRSEKTTNFLKLNKMLLDEKHLSLQEFFDIFNHLDEDISSRSSYLDHRDDKAIILATLRKRKDRLLNGLHLIENNIFHFREHPSLHEYQKKIAYTFLALAPVIGCLLLAAYHDCDKDCWQQPSPQRITKNLNTLFKHFQPQKDLA
ncbi:hypothetical protein FJ364_03090 [Candidatus Dependentiae bacterium]|nr:hypothetical protein [Candidatus Dependentiae bacterium]